VNNVTDIIDVHSKFVRTSFLTIQQLLNISLAHCVPDWYRAIVPTTGGNPTPSWNITGHLAFMASQGISRAVLAFSSPGANVYPGNQAATIALARLINEQSAAYARAYPRQSTFYAVVPLPYTQAAIAEAKYALDTLGAVGIALYSNFEGHYLGDSSFTPFFEAMNARGADQIIYVHPTTPYLRVNGTLIEANPTVYPTGNIEFFFETARMLEDLAVTQTILNFTNINYIIPHVGGAWPSVADRLLKSFPTIYDRTMAALQKRVYWDSAGPTYFHQVAGLLAYGVPSTQLMFGTDYPYAPLFAYAPSLLGVETSQFVTDADRPGIFRANAERLFGGRLPH
jgi:predicted TIM-barrel fold metal-dependent hydrolase